MSKEDTYIQNRMVLESAIKEYFDAAKAIEKTDSEIADDIADVIHDATDKALTLDERP